MELIGNIWLRGPLLGTPRKSVISYEFVSSKLWVLKWLKSSPLWRGPLCLDKCSPKAHVLQTGPQPTVQLGGTGTFKRWGLGEDFRSLGRWAVWGHWDSSPCSLCFSATLRWENLFYHLLPSWPASPQAQKLRANWTQIETIRQSWFS